MQGLEKLAEIAQTLPAGLKENAVALVERMGTTIEGISDKPIEWRPPTAKLIQAVSDRSKLPKNAQIGSLVIGEVVVEQPFATIPIRAYASRQMWDPDQNTARMLCSSPDAKVGYAYGECRSCPNAKFDEEVNRSACNKAVTFICIAADFSDIFFINFNKSNYSNGTDWQKMMARSFRNPYEKAYYLQSETSKKAKNVEVLIAKENKDVVIEGEVKAFMIELARIIGVDREAQIKSFYAYVEERKKNNASIGLPNSADVVLLPAHEETVVEVAEVSEVSASATPSSAAGKKYKFS